jgi:hypothetical protein
MKFSDAFLTTDQEATNTGNTASDNAPPAQADHRDDASASASDEFEDVRPFILDDVDDDDIDSEAADELPLETTTQKSMPAISLDDDETPTRDDLPVVNLDDLDDAFNTLAGDRPMTAASEDDVVMTEPMHTKLERIGGAPIEMPVYDTRNVLQREGLWLAIACLAIIGLLVQYTVYRFDSLAHNPGYRGMLARICPMVGCTLPDETDLQNLQASNLMVRSHAKLHNALTVDFVLSNDAAFDQPYPRLLLQFSDVNGQPLAQRILEPDHYLAGEMAGARKLNAHQSVHVALEIADPGPAAFSYALQPLP